MNSYLISETLNIISDSDIQVRDVSMSYLNLTLRQYIHSVKTEIDNHVDKWERNKKYMNPYEFINTRYDIRTPAVCDYEPISRAFFKMIEILNNYNFNFPFSEAIQSFHLAEGPGGFIEALNYIRHNHNDTYYGITLMNDDKDTPKWNKCEKYLNQNKHIKLEYGIDGTGNLYHYDNLRYVHDTYNGKIDFITADGGFDFSIDFNKQEENSLNLIFAEICFAITMQKTGGSFVLKVFDTFSSASIEMLYLLSYLYEEVYIMKPSTSRPANSEKYVICLNFRNVPNLSKIKERLLDIFPVIQEKGLTSFLKIPNNNIFMDKMKEINSIFGQFQIESIISTLNYITNSSGNNQEVYDNKKTHIGKCIKWCQKNKMPINVYHDIL
jgi:23S rRNA U2552 (ribose-2'-O)-methylase RlmE/FtsJ